MTASLASTSLSQNPLLVMTLLAAIGTTLFALWADYFNRALQHLSEEEPDFDRAIEARKVRNAGFIAFIGQLFVFVGSAESRKEHPWFTFGIFALALIIQSKIQFSAEKKVRQFEATHSDQAKLALRSFAWLIGISLAYFGTIYVSGALFFVIARALHASQAASAVAALSGIGFGMLIALFASLSLSPYYLRKMLPTLELPQDSKWRSIFDSCFEKAKLQPPTYWTLETDRFKANNAMIAGLRSGRGRLRPALLITRPILEECSPEEVKAVVLHEVSHLALNHAQKRFFYSLLIIVGSVFVSTLLIFAGHLLFSPDVANFARIAIMFGAIAVPYVLIRNQVRNQEIEADLYSITNLGATLEALANAMRKIDELNDLATQSKDDNAYLSPGSGHPATEIRIMILRQTLDRIQQLHKNEVDENPSDQKKAA